MKAFLYQTLVALLFVPTAEARRFDFKNERIAPLFGGTYSPSTMGAAGYDQSSGVGTVFDKSPAYNYSAGFGVAWGTSRVGFVVAGEALSPQRFNEDFVGSDAGGTQLFTLHSTTLIYVLTGTLEYRMVANPTNNVVLGLGGGVGFANIDNEYTMTAAGTAALGVGTFREQASQRVTTLHGYLGYEFLLTDTVTMVTQAGYRYMPVGSLLATKAATAITGTQVEGVEIKNNSGTDRTLNMTSYFAGIWFRFFL
jgi:hypothetical protein